MSHVQLAAQRAAAELKANLLAAKRRSEEALQTEGQMDAKAPKSTGIAAE